MRSHGLGLTAVASVTLALSMLVPAAPAFAGSLLSGYGGPGQGSQVILGSTLLRGPARGSGSGGGSGGSTTPGGSVGAGAAGGVGSGAPRSGSGGGRASKSAATGKRLDQAGVQGSGSGDRADTPKLIAAARSASVGSQPLGLSGTDLLWILLALGALGLTGALTKRFARQAG